MTEVPITARHRRLAKLFLNSAPSEDDESMLAEIIATAAHEALEAPDPLVACQYCGGSGVEPGQIAASGGVKTIPPELVHDLWCAIKVILPIAAIPLFMVKGIMFLHAGMLTGVLFEGVLVAAMVATAVCVLAKS